MFDIYICGCLVIYKDIYFLFRLNMVGFVNGKNFVVRKYVIMFLLF